jgi:hypothetical protein
MHRGHGGILTVAEITGLSRTTIRRGIDELQSGVGPNTRVRRGGGGRRSVEKKIVSRYRSAGKIPELRGYSGDLQR